MLCLIALTSRSEGGIVAEVLSYLTLPWVIAFVILCNARILGERTTQPWEYRDFFGRSFEGIDHGFWRWLIGPLHTLFLTKIVVACVAIAFLVSILS
jgi:hypothetical protein